MKLATAQYRGSRTAAPHVRSRKVVSSTQRLALSPRGAALHPVLEAKLKIGAPNDKYEQEADRVADQVMGKPDESLAMKITRSSFNDSEAVQCTCGACAGGGTCSKCADELRRQPEEELQAKQKPGSTPDLKTPAQALIDSLRDGGQPLDLATRAFMEPRFGHDFSRVRVLAPPTNTTESASRRGVPDRAETPRPGMEVDSDVDLAQNETPAPAVAQSETPTPVSTETPVDVAEAKNNCCKKRSFVVSGDSYTDTATDTRKNIKFTVGVTPGSDPKKCVMVNWIKGTAKNKDGTFRKVQMFDKVIDYNFPTQRIDSLDKDPVYASDSSGRWNYEFPIGTGDVFFATDSPGPTAWVDGIDYDLKFKMCLYCIDDVSAASDETGSGVKNPIKCIPWVFKAKFDAAAGKFTH